MEEGLVTRATGMWYRVKCGGRVYDCRLRGNYRLHGSRQTNPAVVGDIVDIEPQADGTAVITDIHDRRNYIVRQATKLSKQTHVIAANIDLLCIVATLATPRTSTGFIDRLLATAEAYRIPSCVIVNKCDLHDEVLGGQCRRLMEVYRRIGYDTFVLSAATGEGVEALRQRLEGLTTLFCGHSGTGKSSLLNRLDPSLQLRVGEVSEWSAKGTHTTTFAEMHPFAGGYLVDTPGIKEFGLFDFRDADLSHCFPEMRELLPRCRFANCTHRHEPHCAVKEAVTEGVIDAERYKNYLNILDSLTLPD